MGKEWVRMAGFALVGAMSIRLAVPGRRKRTIKQPLTAASLVLLLPVILEGTRLLVESGGPSREDLALDIFAILAGGFASLFIPPTLQAFSGFLLFNLALLGEKLSPYRFSLQPRHSFQWIPFYELCNVRTPDSFYEAVLTFVSFAILGGLSQLSSPRRARWEVVIYALAFSGAMEFAQMFLPARTAEVTDILVAGLGAWTGAYFCAAVESARSGQNYLTEPIQSQARR